MRQYHTDTAESYGKAKMVYRYDKATSKFIDIKVYDAKKHVVLTTKNYGEAHAMLMRSNIDR
ncbi:MAG: hypothetical protein K6G10_06925 [Butyrivibrio sp.]|nr:hypothetical protein [Butyrivibrio sp.]